MSLIIGKDSYITLSDMDAYLKQFCLTNDPLRVQWKGLSQEDQEVYLRQAFEQINRLPYTGQPAYPHQVNAFPRKGSFTDADWTNVKNAQAAQTLALTDSVAMKEVNERLQLRRAGVQQYKIGDLSERFVDGLPVGGTADFFGLSERAYAYLSQWLQGGYKICTSIKEHYGLGWTLPL